MKPFISPSFWTDTDVEPLSPEQKLTALWLITNQQTSIIGVCPASSRRFAFETGLPEEALDETLKALPRMFHRANGCIVARNYIRHQFGTGEKLTRNTFFKKLAGEMASAAADVRNVLAADYPEFCDETPVNIPMPSPPNGDKENLNGDAIPQGKEGIGEEAEKERKRSGTDQAARDDLKRTIGGWFRRRESTVWQAKEEKALKAIGIPSDEDLELLGRYYTAEIPDPKDFRRHDVFTLLNNWTGELDRARAFNPGKTPLPNDDDIPF